MRPCFVEGGRTCKAAANGGRTTKKKGTNKMAEIPVEKKSGIPGWVWLLLGLLLLALLLWWLLSDDDEVEVADTAIVAEDTAVIDDPFAEEFTEAELPTEIASAAGVSIADILGDPETYIGSADFSSPGVDVVEVPTDRGFYIEEDGQRLFALINDGPMEVPMDINPGQRLRISEAMLRGTDTIGQLPGDPIDDDTRAILEGVEVFLTVDEDDMEILSR